MAKWFAIKMKEKNEILYRIYVSFNISLVHFIHMKQQGFTKVALNIIRYHNPYTEMKQSMQVIKQFGLFTQRSERGIRLF